MAIILSEEDKQKQQLAQSPQAGAAGMMGGQSAAAPRRSQGSGLFTNLQRYIDANQGNQAVTGAVNEIGAKADQAQNNFNQAKSGLDSMASTTPDYSAQQRQMDDWSANASRTLSNASQNVETARTFDGGSNLKTAQDAYAQTQDRIRGEAQQHLGNVNRWQYQGPQEADVNNAFTRAEDARKAAAGAQGLGLVSNNETRAQHLKEKYNAGRGDYNQGMNRLDNFLVGNSGRDTFAAKSAALKSIADSGGVLTQRQQQLNTQIGANKDAVKNQKNTYFQKLNRYI